MKHLLLIEDDKVDRMAFMRMVRDYDLPLTIETAGSVHEALERLRAGPFDIIISDFYLGDGTPFEILPVVQEQKIPLIIVTGAEDPEAGQKAFTQGAAGFLIKDQNYNYLRAMPPMIRQALSKSARPSDGISQKTAAPGKGIQPPDDRTLPEYEIGFRRIVDDQAELIARFSPDGRLLFVNEVFCRFFDTTRGTIIGKTFRLGGRGAAGDEIAEHVADLSVEKPRMIIELETSPAGGGDPRWLRITLRGVFDTSGSLVEYQVVAHDITAQKKAEDGLRESEERYRMLADHAFDGVIIQDFQGTILYVNSSVVRMFGFSDAAEVIGGNTLAFIHEQDHETVKQDLRNVWEGTEGYLRKYHAHKKAGEEIIIESVGTRIPYHGQPANIIALRDITSREEAERQLHQELARKRDFINVAAHELRTPLQPIISYLDMLIEDPAYGISPDAALLLGKIRSFVETERHLVSQILELSLLDSVHNEFKLVTEPVDVRHIVELAIQSQGVTADTGITLEIPKDDRILSNAAYMHEILSELISNAVKYSTPPRQIHIRGRVTESGYEISVADNGIGIAADKIELIFESFFISDGEKLARRYGRLGVGLTMARKRATMLGGTLTASSRPGCGSVFTLCLPKKSPPGDGS